MSRRASLKVWILVWTGASLLPDAAVHAAGQERSQTPPVVSVATRHAKSPRLSESRTAGPVQPGPNRERPNEVYPKKGSGLSRPASDPAVQTRFGLSQPESLAQFEGASDDDNAAVVGHRTRAARHRRRRRPEPLRPVHQRRRDDLRQERQRRARSVRRATPFWSGLGGPCEVQNDGDPLVALRPAGRPLGRFAVRASQLSRRPVLPVLRGLDDQRSDRRLLPVRVQDERRLLHRLRQARHLARRLLHVVQHVRPDGEVQGGAYAFDRAAMLAGAPAGDDRLSDTGGRDRRACRRISTARRLRRPARRTTS